jgi:tRNA G18 (ribose-2'-O)-methylase SpoU
MDPIQILDPEDPRVHDYTRLTDVALRRAREPAEGLYLAESTKVIRRALAAGHRPRSYLMAPRWLADLADLVADAARDGVPVYVGDPAMLQRLTGFHLHRGAIAAMHRPPVPRVEEVLDGAKLVAVFEDVVDHTNVGAMFRSAAGLGVDAVLVTPRCADPLYRRSVRVSMGTVFQVPWTRIDPWPGGMKLLRDNGFTVAALALTDDAVPLAEFAGSLTAGSLTAGSLTAGSGLATAPPSRVALVLGSEGHGLDPGTVARADLAVRIPMAGGVDSLNVAAASAVAFWALRER